MEGVSASPAVRGRLCAHNSCLAYRWGAGSSTGSTWRWLGLDLEEALMLGFLQGNQALD